jgi:hypothetical protein
MCFFQILGKLFIGSVHQIAEHQQNRENIWCDQVYLRTTLQDTHKHLITSKGRKFRELVETKECLRLIPAATETPDTPASSSDHPAR